MHRQTVHGIVPSESGFYTMVSLRGGEPGNGRITIRQWPIRNRLRTSLLLHRGVYCGIASSWKGPTSRLHEGMLTIDKSDRSCTPWVDPVTISSSSESLAGNLLALISDDAYLCTIPLCCGDASLHSFISIHAIRGELGKPQYFKIGIIVNQELRAVFALAPANSDIIESHIARLRRYFSRIQPDYPFPERVYLLAADHAAPDVPSFLNPLTIKIGNREIREEQELKALGCALAQIKGTIPVFAGSSPSSAQRGLRSAALIASIFVLILSGLTACTPVFLNAFLKVRLHSIEQHYRSVFLDNPELKTMIIRNDSLTSSIFRLIERSDRSTQWGRLFQTLGEQRPEGLYFERLGSEPAASSPNHMRVAIAGFAKNETMITDLISKLQKINSISALSLSSVEKSNNKDNLCNFRIVCTFMTIGP